VNGYSVSGAGICNPYFVPGPESFTIHCLTPVRLPRVPDPVHDSLPDTSRARAPSPDRRPYGLY